MLGRMGMTPGRSIYLPERLDREWLGPTGEAGFGLAVMDCSSVV